MTKHTPGPWRVSADNVRVGPEDGFLPFGACGCCDSPWMMADEKSQQHADARLIAAAPDLLEVLQEMFCDGPVDIAFAGNPNACDRLEARARAAIAKATGDSQ